MPNITIAEFAIHELEGLFSLNDLHKAGGGAAKHAPKLFLRNEQTKALVHEIQAVHSQPDQGTDLYLALKVIHGGTQRGTYACRELVIAYAAWINAAFHLKVIRVFLAQQSQPAEPTPSLLNRRWLISFDHLGREQVQPIDERYSLIDLNELPKILIDPGAMIGTDLIAAIGQACIDRLQNKIKGMRHWSGA